MFYLSGFGDEISQDLQKQMDVMQELNINYMELRSAYDKSVVDFNDRELTKVKDELFSRGFKISAIGSPIGKIDIHKDFSRHLEKFKKIIKAAKYFETRYIRIFSYYIPQDTPPRDFEDEVFDRMKSKVKIAEKEDIILLHENEKKIYGNNDTKCKKLFHEINSPHLKAIFDPANFIEVGVNPYPDALENLIENIEYLHIKDAVRKNGEVEIKAAGKGEANISEILNFLENKDFKGFLSLEPHLSFAGEKQGFSGEKAFRYAANSLKNIMNELNLTYK